MRKGQEDGVLPLGLYWRRGEGGDIGKIVDERSRDEQGASIEGIPTNGRRFTYYEQSNTLGTISMGELYTKCGREQHQLKMASYCDNLSDQGNQVEKD